MKEFENKVVVITGAGSGIGLACAKKFAKEGANIVLFGRNETKLKEVASTFENALIVQGDVSKIADLENLYDKAHKAFGKVDVVIANAGISEQKMLPEVEEAFFDNMISINYKGAFFTVTKALPYLSQGASVVFISSIAAHIGFAGHSVYCSTKSAISSITKSFAAALVEKGIRVNAISPGVIETPIFDKVKKQSPNIMTELSQKIPMGRYGLPEEIAEAVYFLSSPKASYITGVDLSVDGGFETIRSL